MQANLIIPEKAHQEALNWGRAQWSGAWPHPMPSELCGSAERDFHAEWHEEYEEGAPEPARIRPNLPRAIVVHEVWRSLSDLPRFVMRVEYVEHHRDRYAAARSLSERLKKEGFRDDPMTIREYEAHLGYAMTKVGESICEIRR
jgi:hypothetical protein